MGVPGAWSAPVGLGVTREPWYGLDEAMDDPGRGTHDIGGLVGDPIEGAEHEAAFWEKRVDAILMLLIGEPRKLITVDELRRGIEQLGEDAYQRLSYYERWIASITTLLLEKGIITTDELGRKIAEIEERAT